MTVIAIIPARAGSKRLPRKNALEIEPGLNLVQQAINCARDSGVVDHVAVLTDDRMLRFEGAHIEPQPAELAGDNADISAAVAYATQRIENSIGRIHYVVTLQPAVLARSPLIVRRIVEAVTRTEAGGAVTMARTVPWQWSVTIDGEARNAWSPGPYPRSQHCADHFAEINAVQMATRAAVERRERWALPLMIAELPPWAAALDIDDPADLARARDLWPWAKLRLETCEPVMHRAVTINDPLRHEIQRLESFADAVRQVLGRK
jgi:CMP-N-acetylneuraminic acid synthetase